MQQAIPARAGGDYAMTSHSTTPDQPQSETETAVQLFDNWFDPIEAGLRDRAREFLQAMLEAELDEVLDRSRYARRAKRSTGDLQEPAGVSGHRHGHRSRTLLGTFGQLASSGSWPLCPRKIAGIGKPQEISFSAGMRGVGCSLD